MREEEEICIGILTVSDSCASGEATDTSGQNLSKLIQDGIIPNAKVTASGCVSDDQGSIVEALQHWADYRSLQLILTTGGTGFAARDVTPEAVREVIQREANGLSTLMTTSSLRVTPLAALSRPVCGIRSSTIIATLPGSAKAAEECLRFIAPVIPHAVDLLMGRVASVVDTHRILQCSGAQMSMPQVSCSHVGIAAGGGGGCGGHYGHGGGCHGAAAHNKSHHGGGHHHGRHNHHRHHCSGSHSGNNDSFDATTDAQTQSKADVSKISRRPRKSPYPMISVDEAQTIVLNHAFRKDPVQIPLLEAAGYVLAADITSSSALPPFPASIKDGYAVLAEDGSGPRKVVGGVAAGDAPRGEGVAVVRGGANEASPLSSGNCVRINTGAPIPLGANAVVQVEDTELVSSTEDGCEELEINILCSPSVGQDIRPVGCDIAQGQLVLCKHTHLGPPEVGVAAAVGAAHVTVFPKPVVGLLSTGNELQSADSGPLQEGRIYDSNMATLRALLQLHHVPAVGGGVAQDNPQHLKRAITALLDRDVDVLVTTGSVSMGERDILRAVLESDFGATIHFAQVFMKPGKPTTFASLSHNGRPRLVLGLPGNPASAAVTAQLYLLPLVRKMAARQDCMPTVLKAKVSHSITLDPRPEYHRAGLSFSPGLPHPTAFSTGTQLSSTLLSCTSASALLVLPPSGGDAGSVLDEGALVDAILLAH